MHPGPVPVSRSLRTLDTLTLGPARRRRRMTRALRGLDRLDARAPQVPGLPRAWSPVTGPAPMRSRTRQRQLAGLGVLAACIAAPYLLPHVLPARAVSSGTGPLPPRGVGASPQRLVPAVVGPRGSGGFRFEQTQRGSAEPVTYDPCRPVHYVVRLGDAPATAVAEVRAAAAAVSAASGLRLVEDGMSTEVPGQHRSPYQPGRYGARWAPVLIAWSDPTETPGLGGRVAGLGGSQPWADTRGHLTYVTGTVTLDTPALRDSLGSAQGREEVRAVITHELGHVLGLAHADDPRQLMAPERSTTTTLADGDRRGLAALGAGACVPGL